MSKLSAKGDYWLLITVCETADEAISICFGFGGDVF